MSLIVCNIMSLDGHYASTEGNPLVLPMDGAFDSYNLERLREADALVLGADSYRMFMGFWPAQADNPEATEVHREFGAIYRRIPVHVISDSLTAEDVASWREQTTIVSRADAPAHVKELKTSADLLSFGSHVTWNSLLAAGLVDELHLIVGATVLGEGKPIFTAPVKNLTLLEAGHLAGSDNAVLRYATIH